MAKKSSVTVNVTRPQTDDEGSVASDVEQTLNTRKADTKKGRKVAPKLAEQNEEDEEEEEVDGMNDNSDSEDIDEDAEEDDVEGEEDEEMGEDDGDDADKPKPRSSLGQKSFKSTKKPLGISSNSAGSIRKRLEMELAPAAVRRRIKQERFTPFTSQSTGVFMASALETFMRELIDTSVSMAQERKGKKPGKVSLTVQDIQKAIRVDEEFANIFQNVMFATHSVKAQEATTQMTKTKSKKDRISAKA